jgi:hypothetical protein
MSYAKTDAQSDFDVMAHSLELLETTCGTDEAGTGTLRRGIKNIQDRVGAAYSSLDESKIALDLDCGVERLALVPATLAAALFGARIRGYISHYGDLGPWLAAQSVRMHYKFGDIYKALTNAYLSPTSVVYPPVQAVADFTRGASAWTFTHTAGIDSTKYGPAHMTATVHAGVTIGASPITLTVTCVKWDGTLEQRLVTVPNGSSAGTPFDIGVVGDVYQDITNITATGGTSGDRLDIANTLLRSVSTACN